MRDLCCGTGSIGLALAGSARRVIGVEIVEEAVGARKSLANGVAKTLRSSSAPTRAGPRDLIAEGSAPDVIVLDPPRHA